MDTKEISELLHEKLAVDAWWDAYHESLGEESRGCPRCEREEGQWRGYRKKKHGETLHRRWCRSCGQWFGVPLGMVASCKDIGFNARAEKSQSLEKEVMAHTAAEV